MTLHEINLCDPFGTRLAPLDDFTTLDYALVENAVGQLTLVLPGQEHAPMVRRDGRLVVSRIIDGGHAEQRTWLIRRWAYRADGTLLIAAVSPEDLLRRRVTAEGATNPTGPADDVIKALVRSNLGAAAYMTRDWSAYVAVQPDTSAAAVVTLEASYKPLLRTLQDVAEMITEDGGYLGFNVYPVDNWFAFNTYTTQLGTDRRGSGGVVLSATGDMLQRAALDIDHGDEWTVVYAAGEADAVVGVVDQARVDESPFGRIEHYTSAGRSDNVALTDVANAELHRGRPVTRLSGVLSDTPGVIYGRDYGFGDLLTVEAYGRRYEARLSRVSVRVSDAGEAVTPGIEVIA